MEATRRAMEYWDAHWDFELGITHQDLKKSIALWPNPPAESSRIVALASVGALRELLHGASAAPKANLPLIVGMSYDEAYELASLVYALAQTQGE